MDETFSCCGGGARTTVRRTAAGRPDARIGLALRRSQMSGQPDVRGPRPLRSSRPMPSSVIVVDDDPVFRDLARRVLAGHGLVVVAEADSLASAPEAVPSLRRDGGVPRLAF